MKAVVLVGGEGMRLRPLTETIPKPLIPLVDRPFLDFLLDHLASHGVDEVLLSSSYLESAFGPFLEGRTRPPAITWIAEGSPLGTAGAVANAARHLRGTFVVGNGDILTELDLTAMAAFHRRRSALATIALTPVQDARPFGLVDLDEAGRVLAFREKPSEPVPGLINAGTYVLEPEALVGIAPGQAVSIEREVFPALIAQGARVFGFPSDSYWLDLGTPEKYLRASFDVLEGLVGGHAAAAPFVDPGAEVSLMAHLGRWVVVGAGSVVQEGAVVEDSVLLAGARVGAGARVSGSILGPRSSVGAGAVVEGAVLAEGASIAAGSVSEGARVSAGTVLRT